MLRWVKGVAASAVFPFSRDRRCGYRMIDDWIASEQRRDLQSNAVDPFACFGKLLHGLGRQATGLARGPHNATAGFVLRRPKTRFRRLAGTNFLRVQALSGARGLDFRAWRVGFLGCFLRRKIDVSAPHGRRGTLDMRPPQPGGTKQASGEGRGRTKAFDRSSLATRHGCLDPITRGRGLRLSVHSTLTRLVRYPRWNSFVEKIIHLITLRWLRRSISLAPIPLRLP
jgi:hypothetical protein